MQIIQFVFSVIIALCAVAMFVGAVIKSDKGCVGYVVGSYLPILLVSREIGLL